MFDFALEPKCRLGHSISERARNMITIVYNSVVQFYMRLAVNRVGELGASRHKR